MKKLVFLAFCIWNGMAFAQNFDTIRLPNGNISITPELAKELLMYSKVDIIDSGLLGESNWCCLGECDDEDYYSGTMFEMDGEHPVFPQYTTSAYVNGYAVIVDADPQAGYDSPYGALRDGDNNYALVDKQKKICIPFKKFDMITYGVYEGLVTVCNNKKTPVDYYGIKYEVDNRKWGFAAPDGTIKIKLQYEDARRFSEGLAAVKKDGLWGYIDKSGRVVIPFKYTYAGDFKRGVAVVMTDAIIDPNGEVIIDHTSYTYNAKMATGLIDHRGKTTFDLLVEKGIIKEYEGLYIDEATNIKGKVKYTYYTDGEGNRIKHGYYLFYSDYYVVDGHYKDGKKNGEWVEQWENERIKSVSPFFHNYSTTENSKKIKSVFFLDGIAYGDFSYNMVEGGACCLDDFSIYGECKNGIPYGEITVKYKRIKVDEIGAISDTIEYEDYGIEKGMPQKITMIFYKGVPMKVEEYDESTGKRKVLFQYDGFTSVDDIKEIVSNGVQLYKIGDNYYELEPKDPRYPFDLFDVDKYSKEMAKDMSFILNLPASWPIQEVKSPQLNFFRRASRDKIKEFEWPKYSNIFDYYSEYSQAYDQGDAMFKQRIEEKVEAKRIAAYNLNKHLFLSRDEFVSYYKQGEAVYNIIVNERNAGYEDYKLNTGWFVDFHDYLKCGQKGRIDDEVNARKTEYEENKGYFTGLTDFIRYYVQGEEALFVEIDKRIGAYEICKNPDGGYLFKNMAEFLPYYLQGAHNKEYAIRRLQYKMNNFVSLNLKGAKDSKKEDVLSFFDYLAECVAISPETRPQLIEMVVGSNTKMLKEWDKNGDYFDDRVEFYEAYISDDYKKILKSKKKK